MKNLDEFDKNKYHEDQGKNDSGMYDTYGHQKHWYQCCWTDYDHNVI